MSPSRRVRIAWLCFALHAGAVLATVTVLFPGLPPGELAARRTYVATHAVAWGLGWLIWMLAAASVVLLFAAWAETLGDRGWGRLAIGLTLAAAVSDWVSEAIWILLAPGWARGAANEALYATWDRAYVVLSMGLTNLLYTLGGILLTVLSLRTPSFPRWLAGWAAAAWVASLGFTAAALAGSARAANLAAGVLFALFLPWMPLLGHGWLAGVRTGERSEALRARLSLRGVVRAMVPKHPLPMVTVFRECFLVNFAVRPEILRRHLPGPIEPDVHAGDAYVSVVIAMMEKMRPAFLPRAAGVSFCQVVYRVVVRCGGERGVHFLRSDADHRWTSLAGDWLTFFHFHHSRITIAHDARRVRVDLEPGDRGTAAIQATFDVGRASREMPAGSRFATLAAAQAFMVELFAAFAHDPLTDRVSTVRIERGPWDDILVVPDERGRYDFMQRSKLFPPGAARLDSVFYARDMPYRWHALD